MSEKSIPMPVSSEELASLSDYITTSSRELSPEQTLARLLASLSLKLRRRTA